MANSDPLFSNLSSTYTSSTVDNSSVPLGDGAWGQLEEDPEMRCDDDFLDFLNTHQHHTSIGPSAPALNCFVGTVVPATSNNFSYMPLANTEDFFIPSRARTRVPPIVDDASEEMLCGWECPRCKLCLSPHVDACERCAPSWP